ncbi:Mu transposase domain-containing protein [Enterococcus faecalis]|uniref:Mu transposase domain-containing protein n=1 Tax=Enterococcus faecalis TaxID=1351 RepID=UPI004042A149
MDKRIDELLEFDSEKAKKLGPHKQKLTTRSIHEILVSEGFDIAESTIRPYDRQKIQKQREAFIKQVYPLGYRAEFDFGEVKCLINGEKRIFYLAVFSSPVTGYRWGKLYTSSNQQVFIDAHIQFFKEVQGVYSTVFYDNMRNVIQKFVGKYEKELNEEVLKLALFYGFEPVVTVTNTYSGNEKGHVEKSVQVIRDRAFTKIYEFSSIEHAQEYLISALTKLNQDKEIDTERHQLKPMVSDYDYAITTKQKVDKYSLIHVQNNFYSVPDYLVGEMVTVKLYLKELKVVRNGQVVASHPRLDSRNRYQVQMIHYLYTLKRKPGAIEHSLVLTKLPKLRRCFLQFYK